MNTNTRQPGRWPVGYRLALWAVGTLLVLTILVVSIFLLNQPAG